VTRGCHTSCLCRQCTSPMPPCSPGLPSFQLLKASAPRSCHQRVALSSILPTRTPRCRNSARVARSFHSSRANKAMHPRGLPGRPGAMPAGTPAAGEHRACFCHSLCTATPPPPPSRRWHHAQPRRVGPVTAQLDDGVQRCDPRTGARGRADNPRGFPGG